MGRGLLSGTRQRPCALPSWREMGRGRTWGTAHGPSHRRSRPYRLLDTSPRNSVLPRKPSRSKRKQVQSRPRQTGGAVINRAMPEGPIRRPCTSDLLGARRALEATRNADLTDAFSGRRCGNPWRPFRHLRTWLSHPPLSSRRSFRYPTDCRLPPQPIPQRQQPSR